MTGSLRHITAALALAAAAALTLGSLAAPATAAAPKDVYLRAYLTGASEVPGPGDPDGRAVLAIRIHGNDIDFGTRWEAIGAPKAGHLHLAGSGKAGPIVVPLFTSALPDGTTAVAGTVKNVDAGLVARLETDPRAFYANLHTAEFPMGAIRGQLVPSGPQDLSAIPFPVALSSAMSGAQEIGPSDPAAAAQGFVRARGTKVEYAFRLEGLRSPTMAHIHRGVAGVNGPVVVPFFAVPAGLPSTITGIAGRVYGVNAALVKDIAAHPASYYLNLHTATYPAGAVRGQLG